MTFIAGTGRRGRGDPESLAAERERVEDSLRAWARDLDRLCEERERLVIHAYELGISKHRIYRVAGIAPSTTVLILKANDDGPA
jgi:hypothetical protein